MSRVPSQGTGFSLYLNGGRNPVPHRVPEIEKPRGITCGFVAGGFYCDTVGAEEPTAPCGAGHFCTLGTDTATPDGSSNLGTGGLCPTGFYCPVGTAVPLPCAAGTYNFVTGQATCAQCPAGYHCGQNTTDPTSDPCPPGHFCPPGQLNVFLFSRVTGRCGW